MAKDVKRKPTDKQVMAWLYMVVGPVIEGLKQECYFLGELKTPTWRFRQKRCEFIRPISEYVDASQYPTLGQFLRYNPDEKKLIEAHDFTLKELEMVATATHSGLVKLPELQALIKKIETEFKEWRGAYPIEDGPNLLAENVINLAAISELPRHYTNAEAWKKYGQEALFLRRSLAVAKDFERFQKALDELTTCSSKLKDSLSDLQDHLADEYGLPPAPTGTFDSFEIF